MRFSNGFNSQDDRHYFYSEYPASDRIRRQRRKMVKRSQQPATFYDTNLDQTVQAHTGLGDSSGVGSYDDNEEMDFSGMGAGTDQSQIASVKWYDQIGKAAANVATSVLTPDNVQAYALLKLENARNKVNLERAKQGLPPVDMPTATVGLSADTKKFLIYSAGGLALLFILPKLLRK